jgi:hypothetical protein
VTHARGSDHISLEGKEPTNVKRVILKFLGSDSFGVEAQVLIKKKKKIEKKRKGKEKRSLGCI